VVLEAGCLAVGQWICYLGGRCERWMLEGYHLLVLEIWEGYHCVLWGRSNLLTSVLGLCVCKVRRKRGLGDACICRDRLRGRSPFLVGESCNC